MLEVLLLSTQTSTKCSDQYISSITFQGGKPVYVPFRPPSAASHSNVSSADWKLDINELREACSDKTKVLILNTPHNPIGKVFSEQELIEIGRLAKEKNFLILSDEVVRDGVSRMAMMSSLWLIFLLPRPCCSTMSSL